MHSFLRTVGFSQIASRKELDKILGLVMTHPTLDKSIFSSGNSHKRIVEKSLDFSDRMGITVHGEYDEKGFFHLEHYYPYLRGVRPFCYQEVSIYKRMDSDAYTGMCDDLHFGTSLIFYLQNSLDYLSVKENIDVKKTLPVTLVGLSTSGKILLPISKTPEQVRVQNENTLRHDTLLMAAKEGNEEAINTLTLMDFDTYSMIARRILTEDVYSIVETSFIPFGSESDNYTMLGIIKEVIPHVNSLTGELSTEMLVNCNGFDFHIAINNDDLLGEPLPGRRFKGQIWLQGLVDFEQNQY